jgi:serine/threonine protein kinase
MNDIYKIKYKKYKKKYTLLKQLKQEGGNLKFVGKGASGCLFCPPIDPKFLIPYEFSETFYGIEDFSFEKYNSDNYVGKILAIDQQGFGFDSYEKELKQFIKIKDLDPNGDYTPQLIFANIFTTEQLLDSIKTNASLSNCAQEKIKIKKFGYIISKHTGVSLQQKYETLISTGLIIDCRELKKFLIKFNELLKFIKILYDNNYLHLDIKLDNITVKKEEDDKLYLIDFGRVKKIDEDSIYSIIKTYLRNEHEMYSFEPKIFFNLYTKYWLHSKYFNEIINDIKKNFDKLIEPYIFPKESFLYPILIKVFQTDFKKEQDKNEEEKKKLFNQIKTMLGFNCENEYKCLNIDNYIQYHQKDNFIRYLNNRKEVLLKDSYKKFAFGSPGQTMLTHLFLPIIKKYDMYCMGIVLADIVLLFHDFDKCNEIFKEKFIKLIKNLLFYNIAHVDEFITEINELINLI